MRRTFTQLYNFSQRKLFIWGQKVLPQHVSLPQNVSKVSLGPSHNVIISESGNLYSFGSGKYGQLGHGDQKDVENPKLVEYFANKNIKIKDAVCGQRHTLVLTDQGSVYSFGWGGRNINFLLKLIINPVGPLGHGKNVNCSTPMLIKSLQKAKPIERITAGRYFNMVFNREGDVYNWGNGQYAVFGDGNNKNLSVPTVNQYFQYLKVQQKLQVKKVKSCESFSVALMNDNKLYGWGSNQHGQMGIKSQIGIELYETVNFVTEVIRQGYEDKNVLNFDISDNTLLFELQNGEVWWSGMKVAYKPQKIPLDVKPKLFSAGNSCYAIVGEDNKVYSKNGFLKIGQQDVNSGIRVANGSEVFGGNLIGIGGQYTSRYAIVE